MNSDILSACHHAMEVLTVPEFEDDEPRGMSDVEADADTLGSAGMGEDEYYGPGADETM